MSPNAKSGPIIRAKLPTLCVTPITSPCSSEEAFREINPNVGARYTLELIANKLNPNMMLHKPSCPLQNGRTAKLTPTIANPNTINFFSPNFFTSGPMQPP